MINYGFGVELIALGVSVFSIYSDVLGFYDFISIFKFVLYNNAHMDMYPFKDILIHMGTFQNLQYVQSILLLKLNSCLSTVCVTNSCICVTS